MGELVLFTIVSVGFGVELLGDTVGEGVGEAVVVVVVLVLVVVVKAMLGGIVGLLHWSTLSTLSTVRLRHESMPKQLTQELAVADKCRIMLLHA